MKLENLEKLYMHELKDLYSVETQLIEVIPSMIEKATSKALKEALKDHLEETKEQKKRIEKIMKNYDYSPAGHKCKGMEGILEEAKEVLKEAVDDAARDVAIISMCNRIEHYELAGYGTARAFAEQLRKYDEANLLIKSMNEESAADHMLSTLAWRNINFAATDIAKAA